MAYTGPVRRTNIVVDSMDASLAFYRELLGFQPFFDQFVPSGPEGRILNVACRGVRMVVLRADDQTVGMIGLMQFFDADPPLPRVTLPETVRVGEPFLALQSTQFQTVVERLRAAGVPFVNDPVDIPMGARSARECAFRDPSGLLVNLIDASA